MIQQTIKLSVIIPVYNTEEFLEECIVSILKQSLGDLEILLVDDGSTDKSSDIIKKYASQEQNVIALHQNNQGQGAARNLGLDNARGEYITFVDSDDIIPPDVYDGMFSLAMKHDSDMVVGIQQSFDHKRIWNNVSIHKKYFWRQQTNIKITDAPYLLEDISCCNRIIRHCLIKLNTLRFPSTYREDLDFTARLYLLAHKITIYPKVVYHYRNRVGSDTSTVNVAYFKSWYELIDGLQVFFHQRNQAQLVPYLLITEMRKLVVTSRFNKIFSQSSYGNRVKIFHFFSLLANRIHLNDIVENSSFSPLERVRVMLLRFEEYESLEVFQRNPWVPDCLLLLKNEEAYKYVSFFLLNLYKPKVALQRKSEYLISRLGFSSLLRKFSRSFQVLQRVYRTCVVSKSGERVPLFALSCYLLLYPVVVVQKRLGFDNSVWLIDERLSRSAEDNSYFFFKYLRKYFPKFKIFYVINADSEDLKRVNELGQVVMQYSFAHIYLLLHAETLISTDEMGGIAFPGRILRKTFLKTHNVFLQHGVMAVKRTVYSFDKFFYFSQVICSSEREKRIFTEDYRFPEDKVSITGLARFDRLIPVKIKEKNQILIAPTWRRYLKNNSAVKSSKYFWAWIQLIKDDRFVGLLKKHNVQVFFRPHQNMSPLISDLKLDSEFIRLQDHNDTPMHELISKSSILITDYSSIIFDFLYQDKPVICYMFDKKEHDYSHWGTSHIDVEYELPADVHQSAVGVISSLEKLLTGRFQISEEHKKLAAMFFKYRDNKNCERIFNAIKERIGNK